MAPPVYNDTSFRAQFPQFASPVQYPQAALEFAWNMGGNWVSQDAPTTGADTPVTNEGVGTGTGAQATFAYTAENLPLVPGTVVLTAGAIVAEDNGAGVLAGTGVTAGAINYATGVISITYTAAPVAGLPITMAYSYTALAGSCPPAPCGWAPGCFPPWCTGLGMRPAQLQQAADLMGAVLTYQLYGPAAGGAQSYSEAGEAPGAVSSATEGSVSASFQLPEIGSSAFASMLLASPPYGRMLLALLRIAASVGPYIPSGRPSYIPR
jgi:hypothetical protein